jgi:hypothetical protein
MNANQYEIKIKIMCAFEFILCGAAWLTPFPSRELPHVVENSLDFQKPPAQIWP